jgi:hypothetical protein
MFGMKHRKRTKMHIAEVPVLLLPRDGRQPWPKSHRILAGALMLLGAAIAGPAFIVIYQTVTHLMHPYMGAWSWVVPVSGEIAFTFLFLNGLLLALRRAPAGALRGLLMTAILGGSTFLVAWASSKATPDMAGHLVVVDGFYGVLLGGKSTVMLLRGGKVRADRIGGGEWVAHPFRSAALWRWMRTWDEPSRKAAHERYTRLLYAIAIAQADKRVGRAPLVWRRRLPVTLRFQLGTGQFPAGAGDGDDWQHCLREHVTDELDLLPEATPEATRTAPAEAAAGATGQATPGAVTGAAAVPAAGPSAVPAPVPPGEPRKKPRRPSKEPEAEEARSAYRKSRRSQMPLSDRALGEMFGRSRTWGAGRIREVEEGLKVAR